jgi:hypothetical protein
MSTTIVKDNTNEFYVGCDGGTVNKLPLKDMYGKYGFCVVISLKDGTDLTNVNINAIFSADATIDDLKTVAKYMDVSECNINIMKNYTVKKLSNIVKASTLNDVFGTNYEHDQILVPFYTVYTSNVRNYVSMYGATNSIVDVMQSIGMTQMFDSYGKNSKTIIESMEKRLADMSDKYWSISKNCIVPFADVFNERSFSFNGVNLESVKSNCIIRVDNIDKIIKPANIKADITTALTNANNNDNVDDDDYLEGINGNEQIIADNNDNDNNDNNDNDNNDNNDNDGDIANNVNGDYLEGINGDNYLEGIIENGNVSVKSKINPLWNKQFENLNKAIRTDENRTFYINDYDDPVTKSDMVSIYTNLKSESEKVKFIVSMLTSKNHCHLVINNREILEKLNNDKIFSKYRQLFSIVMGYAWATLSMYEALESTRTTKFSKQSFDIETANLLPAFPTCSTDLKASPYFFTPLPDDVIDYNNNFVGMHSFKDFNKYNGVATLKDALYRFNIFCTGDPNKKLINFKSSVKWSISGSVVPACVKKMTPLYERCHVENEYDEETSKMKYTDEEFMVEKWNKYFNEFYGNSDIDVMVETKDCIKFINFGTKLINNVCKENDIDRKYVTIDSTEKGCIVVTPHFFEECIDDVNSVLNTEYTTDTIVNEFSKMTFSINGDNENVSEIVKRVKKEYFYEDYKTEKNENNKKYCKVMKESNLEFDKELEDSYTQIRDVDGFRFRVVSYSIAKGSYQEKNTDICFYVNDFRDEDNKVPDEENYMVYKFAETLKYKIHFNDENIRRPIEIFMTNGPDPFKTVARFHLPIVRCYYQEMNGKPNFYMLPSCISATHGPTSDMIYFAGSRDPCEIVLKYVTRGCGIILNERERKGIFNYCKLVDSKNGMYVYDSRKELFGAKKHTDRIYCPGFYNAEDKSSVKYEDINVEYITTKDELAEMYRNEREQYNYVEKLSLDNIRFIKNDGKITPYENWFVDGYISGYRK